MHKAPRLQWEDLPDRVQAAVQAESGPVVKAETVTDGIMPGLAACLHTEDGAVFLKAVRGDSPALGLYLRELGANRALPADAAAPRLLWGGETSGWVVMLFGYIDGRDADLSPGSPDLPGVLDTLVRLGDILSSCPWPDAPS
jgi:hypothetical protein